MKALFSSTKVLFPATTILFCLTLCIFYSCNNDDEPQPDDALIGKWTVASTSMELSLDNKSLIQYLVDETGISQQDAEAIVNPIIDDLLDSFVGYIEFKKDHTYIINMGGEPDSGTWSLSADMKSLLLDEGTIDETLAAILTLNTSTLKIEMTQNAEDDIDEDGMTEHIIMKISMTLNK